MKFSTYTFVAFICCILREALSTPSTGTEPNNHVECLGSVDPASDSCSVSAILPQHEEPVERHTRKKRQFINDMPPACFSSDGGYGICIPFQQCYMYLKMKALLQYKNIFVRAQDPCTYPTSADVQEIGVCCRDLQFSDPSGGGQYPDYPPFYPQDPTAPEGTPTNEFPTYADPLQPVNWPPPLPTHPPTNRPPSYWPPTQATRPTYPPGPGKPPPPTPIYPPGIKPTTKPPYKPPYKPPFTKPPYKPPVTQRPPWTKPTIRPPMSIPTMKPTTRPTSKPPTVTYPTTESELEDINYSECGIKNGNQDQERIVGGHKADPGEWPWMAAIMTNGRLFCGGSLIDSVHILTAAHCVAHMSPWDIAKMKVHLGDYDIKSKADGEHVERLVMKVVRHAGFDPQTLYNDIAVLTLDTPVPFSRNIRPICLPAGKTAYSSRRATVIGWGSLKEMGPAPSVLQEVNIPIWDNQNCKRKYGPAAPGGIIDSFLCAGEPNRDSCSGDSGGPLMVNDGKWQQVGIVSWGIGCGKGQFPGVYTRLTSYMSWLYKNLHV